VRVWGSRVRVWGLRVRVPGPRSYGLGVQTPPNQTALRLHLQVLDRAVQIPLNTYAVEEIGFQV
jgi:hypothetical protein